MKRHLKGGGLITQCWTNDMVTVQGGAIQIRHNIRCMNPYTSDKNVEYIDTKNMCDGFNVWLPVLHCCNILKLVNKVYNQISRETLALINIVRARECFHNEVILFTWAAPYVTR